MYENLIRIVTILLINFKILMSDRIIDLDYIHISRGAYNCEYTAKHL